MLSGSESSLSLASTESTGHENMVRTEEIELTNAEKRAQTLGFKPQKEIIYNLHLPYCEAVDKEANVILQDIKSGLAKAVQLRDLGVGAVHWSGQLSKYLQLYGRRFSKEDHVLLIKLVYEIMIMPTLELSWVQRYGNILVTLLKKKELLTRDDLELGWRPLYDVVERALYSPYELHGLHLPPCNLENTLKRVVKCCRPYFSLESTQEMLDEWRPLMCPYDTSMIKAMKYFENFLNTDLPPEHHNKGHKLWFDEFVKVLDAGGDAAPTSSSIKILLGRLANRNIGYIDWSPYMSRIFDSLLQSMDLPVGGTMTITNGGGGLAMLLRDFASANWIISLLGGGGNTQKFLNDFLKGTETYFHPSNIGRWTPSLMDLLGKLCQSLVNRLDRERSSHKTWIHPIPDDHKLTNQDVTEFVLGMKNVAFLAIFSKRGQREATQVIQHLACLRPELIIPQLLETAYPAMENLTEPHRLLSCLMCLTGVGRILMQSNRWYSAGRLHVIPLLYLALPGIDPNDTNKSWTAMQMISTLLGLIPIVDCSQAGQYYPDLSEEDLELCQATAQFEDFAILLLERLIGLIESFSQDGNPHHGQTNDGRQLSHDENLMQKFISSTFNALIQQSSKEIYRVINKKLFNKITSSMYDIRVAGSYFGTMLKSLSKARPAECLKLFIPKLCDSIMTHNNEATRKAENLDGQLLWNMTMLSDIICCDGKEVLPHVPRLMEVLDFVLDLNAKEGYEISAGLLEHLLIVLQNTYILEYRSSCNVDKPVNEYLHIRDWGIPGDLKNIEANWHVQSDEERAAVAKILGRYLVPQLDKIKAVAAGDKMSREEMLRRLRIVDSCVRGCSASADAWKGEQVDLVESEVPLFRHRQVIRESGEGLLVQGQNARELVARSVRPLVDKMLKSEEDDTKSLLKLIDIYHHLLMFNGTKKDEFDLRWRSFHLFKKLMQNKLLGKKKHVRSLLLHRIQLQHDLRLSNKDAKVFTELHRDMFLDLYRLSVSLYPEVRKKAQGVLNLGVTVFAYSSRVLIPSLIHSCTKSEDVPHHEFKGALYVLLGDRSKPRLAASKYWKPLLELWPVIVQADHSEKPSILALIDRLVDRIHRQFESPGIRRVTSDSVVETAGALWLSASQPGSMWEKAEPDEIAKGEIREQERNNEALNDYQTLIQKLVELLNAGKLHWKFHEMGMELIALLLRHDAEIPVPLVDLYTKNLIHDSLNVRKLCINGMMAVLKLQKRRAKRLEIPGSEFEMIEGKPNNEWLKLTPDYKLTEDVYNKAIFLDKTHWGFYAWPKVLKYHAPAPQQPTVDRKFEELPDVEKPIYTQFMDTNFVDKLMETLCLEEQKGQDRFCTKRAVVFKGLFRNFGPAVFPLLKPHLERLIGVTDPTLHESSHRVAAEIMSGFVRGSKHWKWSQVEEMWAWTIPQFERVLNSLTVENIAFWSKCLELCSESRDPRRMKPLFDLLMNSPLRGEGGSFGDSGRMRILQGFLTQQEWRVPVYQDLILATVRENMNHAYKNVRDRLASFMTTIFICDRDTDRGSLLASPKQEKFLNDLEADLALVAKDVKRLEGDESTRDDEEWKSKQRVCKTLFSWLKESFQRMIGNITPDVYKLLPLLCLLVSDCDDEELRGIVAQTLKLMPRTQVHKDNIPVLIDTMTQVSELKPWQARVSLLKFIQSHIFYNLFTLGEEETRLKVKSLVLKLLKDDHLEVRELAAVTFGGLLQCGYFEFNSDLLDHFEKLSGDKKRKRRRALKEALTTEELVKRHAGILGLCSCVLAYPYDVPAFVPAILVDLSGHLDDPQPIQLTVKKALSNFRRTHHDNWQEHKEKFTDDQLVVLTDVLVSPNYYA